MKLIDYFNTDYLLNRVSFKIESVEMFGKLKGKMFYDFNAGCRFLSFYVEDKWNKEFYIAFIDGLRDNSLSIFHVSKEITLPPDEVAVGDYFMIGEKGLKFKNYSESEGFFEEMDSLQFSGRVYFYVECPLEDEELIEIMNYGKEFNYRIKFRTPKYAEIANAFKMPKAFISHDSRDKVPVVETIVKFLNNRWCPVWYDKYSLTPGDSLVKQINQGLTKAPKCLMVISKNYIANKGWASGEFESVVNEQITNDLQKIIPIWLDVEREEVAKFNSYLANRVAIIWNSSNPLESLERIYNVVKK